MPRNVLKLCRTHFNDAVNSLPPERIRLELEKIVGI